MAVVILFGAKKSAMQEWVLPCANTAVICKRSEFIVIVFHAAKKEKTNKIKNTHKEIVPLHTL
jgi:hypothetical protein